MFRRDFLYPMGDKYPGVDGYVLPSIGPMGEQRKLRARWTGEFRPPKKGEWYLSGAMIAAYQAKADMTTTSYCIAEIVQIEETTTYHVVKVLPMPEKEQSCNS